MAVGVPGHLHVGVPEPARDLLYVYSLVDKQGSVRVPEVVDTDMRKPCCFGKCLVVVLNRCVPQRNFAPAHAEFLAEQSVSFLLAAFVLVQYLHQRGRYLQVAVAGFVLRGTLDVAAFELLRNAPAYVQDISVNVRPFQRVYLAFAGASVERDAKEYIISPVRCGLGVFLCFGDERPELLRGVVVQLVRRLLDALASDSALSKLGLLSISSPCDYVLVGINQWFVRLSQSPLFYLHPEYPLNDVPPK